MEVEDDIERIIGSNLKSIPEFKGYNVAVHHPDRNRFTGIVFGYHCDPLDSTAGVVLEYFIDIQDN